ncbi:MAG: hypothetical protein AB7O21_17205 [Gammaproteobacteria bacterium]
MTTRTHVHSRPRITFWLPLLLTVAALCAAGRAHAVVALPQGFDVDAEGWTGLSCVNPGICTAGSSPLAIQHLDTGGNPGGYIRTQDPSSLTAARLVAPGSLMSGLAVGQILSFDALVQRNGGDGEYDGALAPLVTIESAVGILIYVTFDLPLIDGPWKHFDVPLAAGADWRIFDGVSVRELNAGEFETVFAAMTHLTLIGEWLNDTEDLDTGGIDNVNLAAVPVPPALPLLAPALGWLAYRRRR